MALDVMLGWRDYQAVGKIWRFLSNFSVQKLLRSTAIKHIRLLLILFIIFKWVYQMIIQAHLRIIVVLDVMLGWRDYQAVGKIWRFLSNFSAQNLLINSHQAHQIAAHPFHHLQMGLQDDNPSSLGDHYSLSHWMSCWVGGITKLLARFGASCPTFQFETS
jgi:IS1 family transposase